MKKIIFFLLLFPALLFGQDNPSIIALKSMGSTVKASTVGLTVSLSTVSTVLTDGRLYLVPVYLQFPATITGVKLFMSVQGDYTADNNNKVGLYTVSGGTATLVASCANDATLWKSAANTLITKAFSSQYVAVSGLYYVGFVYNQSAVVAAPQLCMATALFWLTVASVDFTNSNTLCGYIAATDLTTPLTMSTLTNSVNMWIVSIY